MIQSKIKIKTKNQSYNVIVGNNLTNNLKDNLIKFNKCLLVIDNKVPNEFIKKINFALKKKKFLNIFLIPMRKIKIKKILIKYLIYF